jgi:hypothetical protein
LNIILSTRKILPSLIVQTAKNKIWCIHKSLSFPHSLDRQRWCKWTLHLFQFQFLIKLFLCLLDSLTGESSLSFLSSYHSTSITKPQISCEPRWTERALRWVQLQIVCECGQYCLLPLHTTRYHISPPYSAPLHLLAGATLLCLFQPLAVIFTATVTNYQYNKLYLVY